MSYHRVTLEHRCQIEGFLQAGISQVQIARTVGKHKSTISRELSRNRVGSSYQALPAHHRARHRFKRCRRLRKMQGEMLNKVGELLTQDWSPEQISKRLKLEGVASVSFVTIYKTLNHKTEPLRRYLRRFNKRGAGRYRQRRRFVDDDKLNISLRPKSANQRSRIGDWERDTMNTRDQHRQQVLACVDRKSRFVKLGRSHSSKTHELSRLTLQLTQGHGYPIHTVTNDNGAGMREKRLGTIPIYHCDPRRPQQRGTVENTIGLLRQYIPRSTNLALLPDEALHEIENRLNLRPRKCLGFKTPFEVFFKTKVALAS